MNIFIQELQQVFKMEQNGTSEKNFRLNFSQNTKGEFFADWTTRADTIEELAQRTEEVKQLALAQLEILNGKVE